MQTLVPGLRRISMVAAAVGVIVAAQPPAQAQTVSAPPKADIERMVREYLLNHPEVIVEAMGVYKRRQEEAEQAAVASVIESRHAEIFRDPEAPADGNASGDVTLVEFFDYRCSVCKRVHPLVDKLMKSDSNIRRVYKEWPILGPNSVYAARAALASRKQGKYFAFHDAMMASHTSMSPQAVLLIAKHVGLDTDRLRQDMKDPEIAKIIERNFKLAEALKINGTPSFLIGNQLIHGARDLDGLRELVAEARRKAG